MFDKAQAKVMEKWSKNKKTKKTNDAAKEHIMNIIKPLVTEAVEQRLKGIEKRLKELEINDAEEE